MDYLMAQSSEPQTKAISRLTIRVRVMMPVSKSEGLVMFRADSQGEIRVDVIT